MQSHFRWLIVIVLLTAVGIWVALPVTSAITNITTATCTQEQVDEVPLQGIHFDTDNDCEPDLNFNVQQVLGLDLVGGFRVLLTAELPAGSYTLEDLREAANNVNRRVNGLGLTEATVQVQGNNRILVEIPGITDRKRAIDTIQKTALLEFVDFGGLGGEDFTNRRILTTEQLRLEEQRIAADAEATAEAIAEATTEATVEATPEAASTPTTPDEQPAIPNPVTGQPFQTIITGAGLEAASAQFSTQIGWYIEFALKPEAADVFGPFTASRVNEPMAIVLDGVVLSAPRIDEPLKDGGIIRGSFTEDEAKQLALQLRSGALPIPLRLEYGEEVGATLGQESVRLSIRAGVIGVMVVLAFMLIYYRVPGVAADLALLVFVILNLAAFKLIPVTLTLPAITGFLISIGTAVDGNILIFERVKEELRAGSELDTALTAGFDRAWNSIRDSNLSTIIICGILLFFGQTPGASIVSGFAITLALGLIINLFTAIIVTRTFLHLLVAFMRNSLVERRWLLGV